MSFSESLKPHIPYLRRYARILTGSQHSGDNYVKAALEAAIAGQAEIDQSLSPQVALYQLFHTTWDKVSAELGEDTASDETARVTPVARQVLLLTAVEGFSKAEAATILRVTPDNIEGLLMKAHTSIDNALRTNVMIIEDEPIIALDIESIVENNNHSVVGIARTHTEAVALARETKPGLILADIQLADNSSGIDAVKEILQDMDVPVIFITAYPERLLTGERPEPTYLITKPFMPETVSATMAQALFFSEGLTQEAQLA